MGVGWRTGRGGNDEPALDEDAFLLVVLKQKASSDVRRLWRRGTHAYRWAFC